VPAGVFREGDVIVGYALFAPGDWGGRVESEPYRGRAAAYGLRGDVGFSAMPLPAPPGQRRRRNLSPAWQTLPVSTQVDTPPMPSPSTRRRWSRAAHDAWRSWWESPMAAVWIEADRVALRRAHRLVDDLAVGRTADHGALTALEDRLGLSPLARRPLQWEIGRPTPDARSD
jgi:hypothetical protein